MPASALPEGAGRPDRRAVACLHEPPARPPRPPRRAAGGRRDPARAADARRRRARPGAGRGALDGGRALGRHRRRLALDGGAARPAARGGAPGLRLARRPRGARQPAGAGAGAGLGAGLDQPLRARRRPGMAAGDSRAAGDALDGPCGAPDRGSRPRRRRPLLADARRAPALPREGVGLARAGPAAARGARRPGLDRAGAAAPRPCDRARRDGGEAEALVDADGGTASRAPRISPRS